MYKNNVPAKRIAILGSTGSIGQQTLDVVRAHPDLFKIKALAAGNNVSLLEKQIAEFEPDWYCLKNTENSPLIRGSRPVSLEEMVSQPEIDLVVAAMSGTAGLNPVITAIRAGKIIALANKEPLVMAGPLILAEMKKGGGWILPVDSEHSAIWQCLNGENGRPARIILTASGGPFLRYTAEQLKNVTPEQALKHPSWKMGPKVTIDSATLMNKGLEVIEAHWLFDLPFDQIDILIHSQSIVHSMVELVDGSIKAHLSYPDMRLPIQYALSYPERIESPYLPKLDWKKIASLEFAPPDVEAFPCLKLALECGRLGGTYPAVLCGADETAVELFLKRHIPFTGIAQLIENVVSQHHNIEQPDLPSIIEAEQWARQQALALAGGGKA
jgi:1-deoxy-D-xylulose-5-phosphate reductoisomerase